MTLLLPNSLLVIDHWIRRQGICIPGLKLHDSKSCWCAVAEELQSKTKLWVTGAGMTVDVADPPSSLLHLDLDFRDSFGNTALHLLAARSTSLQIMMEAIQRVHDVNAVNTAGQTFLHVLQDEFFRDLVYYGIDIIVLLERLDHFNVTFYNCDIFGVNFFHILARAEKLLNRNILSTLKLLDINIPSTRDAFGLSPGSRVDADLQPGANLPSKLAAPTTIYNEFHGSHVLPEEGGASSSIISNPTPQALANKEIYEHARLLEIARLALENNLLEDSEGRNGLQCLAEVSLTMTSSGGILVPRPTNKRKRNESKIIKWHSTPFTLRYELVQNMLHCEMRTDVNHYDKQGNTVLTAFVIHLCDGEDDNTLVKLLNLLIQRGADIHRRNRQGETALHVAVRLGRKIATKVLLENGANVHARTLEGKGVLAVGEEHCIEAAEDQHLYSSILACMALAIRHGAVAAPTLVQEWSLPSLQGGT